MTPPSLDFRLIALFPADHAEVVNGKVYANGAFWNRLTFPTYPHVVPSIALVAVLEIPFAHYHAEHVFAMGLVDPDDNPTPLKVEGQFRVGASADMEYGDPSLMPIAVPIHNLVLHRPGDYSFTFAVDGNELGRYPIRAMQVAIPLQFQFKPPAVPPESEAS